MKYRVKIIELNNGNKQYIPQHLKLIISGSWMKRTELFWYNIIQDGTISNDTTEYHSTEEKALEIIEKHKMINERNEGKKVKSITFKIVD